MLFTNGVVVKAAPNHPRPKDCPETSMQFALSESPMLSRIAAIGLRLSTHCKKPSKVAPVPPLCSSNPGNLIR